MPVVDASVAIKWVVPEDGVAEAGTDAALALLDQSLLAPEWMMIEFGNAMWKKVRHKEIGVLQAREALSILPTIVSFVSTDAYVPDALDIALTLDHPLYDCVYLAVARAHDLPFVTADKRLLNKCQSARIPIPIIALADYVGEAKRTDL